MQYLIDGYNLLHVLGMPHKMGPHGLEQARRRLLGMLSGALGEAASAVTVVFDAAGAPPDATPVGHFGRIEVLFAIHHDEADDLIELLIQQTPAPRRLTIVSDDRRLRMAAQRWNCPQMGCVDYLEWLEKRRQPPHRAGPARGPKPNTLSKAETQYWLREFGDLENDPEFKELFNPWDFGEE